MIGSFGRKGVVARMFEEKLYEAVVAEMSNGIRRDGLWAKAIVGGEGSEERSRALYIKYRVQSLRDEILITSTMEEWLKKEEANSNRSHAAARGGSRAINPEKQIPRFEKPCDKCGREFSATQSQCPNCFWPREIKVL